VENKTVEMVVKDLLLADNQRKKKKVSLSGTLSFFTALMLLGTGLT